MYIWFRNTHLFLGLFCLLFLLVYGVSSVQMAHNTWFAMRPAVIQSRVPIRAENASNPRAVARQLMDEQHMQGDLFRVRQYEEGVSFQIVRPGTVYEVNYSAAAGEARVRTNRGDFMGMLNRIHHIGGLWHEYSLINVWGVLVGIVSAALILMALTGIYMWFHFYDERIVGIILLALSLGYSVTLMVLIRRA